MSTSPQGWRLNGRPVRIADFGDLSTEERSTVPEVTDPPPAQARVSNGLRNHFPAAGESFEGGISDGYCFRLDFRSSNPDRCLAMIRAFLGEHGYDQLPLPADYAELKVFRLPRRERRQLHLFADDGYAHNPIKILFPPPGSDWRGLRLEIFNEQADRHLLRFHGRG